MARKIPQKYENPVDDLLIALSDAISNYLIKFGTITPNMITLMAFLTGIMTSAFLWNKYYFIAGVGLYVTHFFDCLDGHYARKI